MNAPAPFDPAHARLIDATLEPFRDTVGRDFTGYKNHVTRVAHFCLALHPCDPDAQKRVVLAACFHDLGIWPTLTLDYLPPSVALARAHLTSNGLEAWAPEVTEMIDLHHRVRAHESPAVEAFRRADLIDVSLGLLTQGLSRDLIRDVRGRYPNAGFHLRLVQLGLSWTCRHPLRPLPFMRW